MANVLRLRAGENLNQAWGSIRQRAPLPGGPNIGDPSKMRPTMVGETRSLQELVALRGAAASRILVPEMIDVPGLPIRVMKGVATGGQLATLVQTGYGISGHNESSLKALIADEAKTHRGIGYISLLDQRAFVAALKLQNPGSEFRGIANKKEWDAIHTKVGSQLLDTGYWNWTEEETGPNSGIYILRHLGLNDLRNDVNPENRYYNNGLRLVEDMPVRPAGK